MTNPLEPPSGLRQLGRSRPYTHADLPERLAHWHSPRINRWERVRVAAGELGVERLGAAGVTAELLQAGESRWIAPGTRWRVARLACDARFELEVHAENRPAEVSPQPLRVALLAGAERVECPHGAAFGQLVRNLGVGERRLLRGRFQWRTPLHAALEESGGALFWHPLATDAASFTAFIARAAQPIGLAEYLGRDHAVMEAALAGTLGGDREYAGWLQATLARHLAIEEELLFPAYLAAGGRAAWVRGLKNEHQYLRQYLASLAEPDARRKFLRLLDGHDEKEERVVYPDILARVEDRQAGACRRLVTSAITAWLPSPGAGESRLAAS